MFQKRFVVLWVLLFGLGVLSACGSQAVPPQPPAETPSVEPAVASATGTVIAPESGATIEQPAQESATPTEVVEDITADQTPGLPALACNGELEPTVSNAEGPYYKSGAPERTVLVEAGMPGTRLVLTGQVLTTDCRPVAGAQLDFWQADDRGEYDNVGYILRGRQVADEMGRYPSRPPHIHVKVNPPGGPVLTTQIYFEGEPGNEGDGLVQPSLIVPLTDTADGGKAATFNFVLVVEQAAPAPDGGVWCTAKRCMENINGAFAKAANVSVNN